MVKVDLTAAPYYLNTDQITWVEETLNNLTDEEKLLFETEKLDSARKNFRF